MASTDDYVVVGAGSAGCVVAARLSEDTGRRVLLLEAGTATIPRASRVPPRFPELLGSAYDWGYSTVPQSGTTGAVYPWPRGKLMGGTAAINAMAFIRGAGFVFDSWVSAGAKGWSYEDLLPFFRRSERTVGRNTAYRGTDGPLRVAPVSVRHPVSEAFHDAVVACGHPSTDDLNVPDQYGVGWYDVNIVDGFRQTTADAYLTPHLDRANLTVVADALVTGLTVEHGRCRGVVYEYNGESRLAHAEREVILCAGAVGSPQLLMVSGVGPADHLRWAGVPVVVDLPGVGANLHDHVVSSTVYAVDDELPPSVNNYAELSSLLRTAESVPLPDIQIYPSHVPRSPVLVRPPEHGYSIMVSPSVPHSRGILRLAGADVRQQPLIDPRYLDDERDVDTLVAGLRMARRIGAAEAFGRWKPVRVTPAADEDDIGAWRAIARRTAANQFHPVGSCRIGVDTDAVVDHRLRVRGVQGLRVADASVFPSITSMNPHATVIAVAERAAAFVAEDSAG